MVEFYDPITNKKISYHIDKKIKLKWDKLKEGRLKKIDEDRCYLVDGRERVGKSVFTFQQAKYIDPSFNIDRVCFYPDDFLDQIKTAKEGQVVVFDEAFRGLSSKASQSKVNKKIIQALMEVGQRNLIIFIVLPTIFLLELYAAVLRSNALFHIYKDPSGKRAFKIYNYKKKSILYNFGKKKGFSYSFPRVKLNGRFFNIYAINEKEYRKKKIDTFTGKEEEFNYSVDPFVGKYQKLLAIFKIVTKLSEAKTSSVLTSYGLPVSPSYVGDTYRKMRDLLDKPPNPPL